MLRSARTRLALSAAASVAVAAAAGTLAAGNAASAHDDHPTPTPTPTAAPSGPADNPVYLAAVLNGRNEVPAQGGPAVGDKDGQAIQVLRIKGDQVAFALSWKNVAAPTAGHIHLGARGVNGAVKIPFFGSALPGTLNAAVGKVTIADKALLDEIKANPTGFYANLHTAEFPGGAVRGQLHTVTNPVDLNSVLRTGPLSALLDSDQEVPPADGKAFGDPDGSATAYVRVQNKKVDFSFKWAGVQAPNNLHLHEGPVGTNGPVAIPLFPEVTALPASFTGVAGTASGVKPEVTDRLDKRPTGFYANVHTPEFPGGAVRGQLFRTGFGNAGIQPGAVNASVVSGEQIYKCNQQPDGTYAYTQHNVRATLAGNIKHSFVADAAGPPQWIAADGSAVTGKLISRSANGAENIAELDLAATSSGKNKGRFASTVEILRLNTVGGLAPTGTCDPQKKPIAKSPYQADYLFIG
jgi:hypothetical protein